MNYINRICITLISSSTSTFHTTKLATGSFLPSMKVFSLPMQKFANPHEVTELVFSLLSNCFWPEQKMAKDVEAGM